MIDWLLDLRIFYLGPLLGKCSFFRVPTWGPICKLGNFLIKRLNPARVYLLTTLGNYCHSGPLKWVRSSQCLIFNFAVRKKKSGVVLLVYFLCTLSGGRGSARIIGTLCVWCCCAFFLRDVNTAWRTESRAKHPVFTPGEESSRALLNKICKA